MEFYAVYFCLIFYLLSINWSLSYVCNDKSCDKVTCDTTSVCLRSNTSKIIKNGASCKCCDLCIEQLPYGTPCKVETDGGIPGEQCADGLTCDSTLKKCVYRVESNCICEQRNYDQLRSEGALIVGKHRPICDSIGNYVSKRCITGSVCFCVDPFGNRIFGTDYEVNEKSMQCNCSREAETLRQNLKTTQAFYYGDNEYNVPPLFSHCLPNGNYDPLQCVGENCYCLNKDLTLQGSIVSLSIKETLVCYNPDYHDESYYRICEVLRNYMIKTMENATDYNTDIVGVDLPKCSLDGFFEAVQCRGDMCYCTYSDGLIIPGFNATRYSDDAEDMNCYCATDLHYVTDPVIKQQIRCTSNGSYEPIQCQGNLCYCVDKFGVQFGGEVHKGNMHLLDCSNANGRPPCSATLS